MKNKKLIYTTATASAIAAVSIATPAFAMEGQANTEAGNGKIKEYTPTIFTQSGNGEKVLFIGGSTDYSIHSNDRSGYSYLKNDLNSNNYKVDQKPFSSITLHELLKTDIVVFHIHSISTSMSEAEVNMLREYVMRGGALLLLGNLHTTSSFDVTKLNSLASVFGIEFLNGLVVDEFNSHYDDDYATPVITDLRPHPIVEGITTTWLNYGTALKVTSPAKTLAYTSPNSYLETNSKWDSWEKKWTYKKDRNDIEGPLPVLAASEFGLGRVVAIGDGGIFINYDYNTRDANHLFANMIDWLKVPSINREVTLEAKYPAQQVVSKVMAGGSAIRTYVLKDDKGLPLKNYTIEYKIGDTIKQTKSDSDGNIKIMTPVLSAGANQKIKLEIMDTTYETSFTVDVEPRQFEQSWMVTAAVNGSIGVGVGIDGKIGKLASLDLGADATRDAGVKSYMTMKALTNGGNYDLLLESAKSQTAGASASAGLQAGVKSIIKFNAIKGNAELELENVLGANMLYKDFNNPENYKAALSFSIPLFYETLAMGVAQSEKIADNQLIVFLLEQLEREIQKNKYNTVGIFSKQSLTGKIDASLLSAELDYEKADFELEVGILNGAVGSSGSLHSEIKSNGDLLIKNTVNGEMSGSIFNLTGGYKRKYDERSSQDISFFEGEYAMQVEEETLYRGSNLKEYSFALSSKEDINGSAFNGENEEIKDEDKEKEEADIVTIKYTINQQNLMNFSAASVVKKALESRMTILNNPAIALDSLLGLDAGNGQLIYEEKKYKEDTFELPLELGIGIGPKIDVGFELAGTRGIEYISEQGAFVKGDTQYLTAAYQYDDIIEQEKKELKTIFNSAGDMVGEALKDVFYLAKETAEGLLDTAKDFGDKVVNAATVKYVKVKDTITKKIVVSLGKISDFLPFSIQTENGQAIVVGEVFFLAFNDVENNQSVDSLGDATVPLIMDYPEELIANLGLKEKEEGLAIYRWDEKKVTYVRMDSKVDTVNNKVSIDTNVPGQYILAYNEFNPQVGQVNFKQHNNSLTMTAVVKDSFEQIDSSKLSIKVNGTVYDNNDFDYNPSTGELVLTVSDLPYNKTVKGNIYIEGELADTFTYLMLDGDVNITRHDALVNPKNMTFVADFDKASQVKNASVEYSINGGNVSYIPLVKQGNVWVALVESENDIFEVNYRIKYETIANAQHKTETFTAQSETFEPIKLVDDSLLYDYQETTKPIALTFNHPLSNQSKLENIRVVDKYGQDVAVTKTIRNNQLVINPAYDVVPGEVSVIIPSSTLETKYSTYITNDQPITFTYEAVNMQKLDVRSKMQPWTITFSEVVQSSLDKNMPFVTDLEGNTVATKLKRSNDGKQIIITPVESYNVGETYILHVNKDLQNKTESKTLQKGVVRLFTIK